MGVGTCSPYSLLGAPSPRSWACICHPPCSLLAIPQLEFENEMPSASYVATCTVIKICERRSIQDIAFLAVDHLPPRSPSPHDAPSQLVDKRNSLLTPKLPNFPP